MNEPLRAAVDAANKSSMTLTLSTDDNTEEATSEHSFPGSVRSVENLLLKSPKHGNPDSDDLSLSHLEGHILNSEQKVSVIHSSSGDNNSINNSVGERSEANRAPAIFSNIEVIEEIHRKAQSTLLKCLRRENSFLRVAASQHQEFHGCKSHSEPQVSMSNEAGPLADCSESKRSLQTSMTKSAMLAALQEELEALSASANLYRQKAVRAEEQRRLAVADLNKETGKLKMLEQVVLDKDAEIHRLLAENLEASRFISATSKGIQKSPSVSMSTTSALSLNSTSLDKQLEAVTRYSSKIEDQLRNAETELKLYRDSIEEKDQKILELSTLVQQKTAEADVVKEQLLSAEDLLRDQKEAAANYKNLFRDRSRALEKTTFLLNSKTNELDVAMSLASEIQRDTNNIAATLTSKDQQIAELEAQLSKASRDSKALKVMQLTLASQERQLKANDESISNLEAQILAKNNLIRTLTSTVDARDASIKDLEQRLLTMHSSATSSSLAIVSAEKQSLEYKQHVDKLIEEIKTYKEELRKQQEENTLLKRQLSEIDQLEEQRLKQSSQLIVAYKRKEDDLATVLQALADFEKKYADVSLLAAEQDAEVQRLKQLVLEKDSEIVELVANNGLTQLEASRLQTEIAALRGAAEEARRCNTISELFCERISRISRVLSVSQSAEAFLTSKPLQDGTENPNSGASLALAPVNELAAAITAFVQRIQKEFSQSLSTIDVKSVAQIDACVNTITDTPVQQTCPIRCSTEERGVQSMAPSSPCIRDNSELERLLCVISEKDRELVSLRDIIICKNEQIRRLLEDAEY